MLCNVLSNECRSVYIIITCSSHAAVLPFHTEVLFFKFKFHTEALFEEWGIRDKRWARWVGAARRSHDIAWADT